MLKFFQAIGYIISLDRFEYDALKRDAQKQKNTLVAIISNVVIITIIIPLIYQKFLLSFILLVFLVIFAFFQYYWKPYQVFKNQLGNPFYINRNQR